MQRQGNPSIDADARAFYDESFAALLAASPEVASEIGVTEIGGRRIPQDSFAAVSPADDEHRRTLMADTLARLSKLPVGAAGSDDYLNRQIYEFFLRWGYFGRLRGTESHGYPLCDSIADHLSGVQTEMVTCLSQWQRLETAEDADCYLSRLSAVPRQIEAMIEGLRARQAAGNVMPACIVQRVMAELSQLLSLPMSEQPILRRFVAARGPSAVAAVEAALEEHFLPAYRRLRTWFARDYPHEDRIGLCRLRDGNGYYHFLLKAHTTTELTAAEIHGLGQRELAVLHESIGDKLAAAGYGGDTFRERLTAFNRDHRFRLVGGPADRGRLQRQLEEIIRDTTTQVMPLFGIRPRADVSVVPVPPPQEANRHSNYVPPNIDGSRRGIFEVNLASLQEGGRLDMYTLAYHEAMPGHHVQLTIAQELGDSVPSFRRILVHDGYIEGWAKYAELLPQLAGINTDPHWDIARSRSELYSTANLALDTGIHALGWTREEGIAFFATNTACSPEFAAAIVDRIVAQPAQVCAYKIGMMSILGARNRMERALGNRFDICRFHDLILGRGSMPLALLDRVVDAEIEGLRQ